MKKIPIIILVAAVAILGWYYTSRDAAPKTTGTPTTTASTDTTSPAQTERGSSAVTNQKGTAPVTAPDGEEAVERADEGIEDEARPATELYKSADEALKAVKDGSQDYDDLVLEQFLELGSDCSWCDQFYSSVKATMAAADTTPEQRSYFAEVLAISGRVDNLQSLVDLVKTAKTQEEADVYAEALELAVGKDDVVKYLSTELSATNETLKEAAVAAITNQGSLLAANELYKHTLERGDPDGYYSQGIGLGELIPDEEALPFLQDAVTKRDAYSHLAAKALLNNGIDGLRRFLDVMESSPNGDFDKQMVSGLVDHVSYEDEIEALLRDKEQNSKSEVVKEFAKQALADFNVQETEDDAEVEEQ